jgi:hypothetical protein
MMKIVAAIRDGCTAFWRSATAFALAMDADPLEDIPEEINA